LIESIQEIRIQHAEFEERKASARKDGNQKDKASIRSKIT
jgi:hypothetical protein